MTAANYTDGGLGGIGTFRQDTNWTPLSAAAEFIGTSAVPEPGTLGFLCCGVIVIGGLVRRRRRQ
jgi:PEP-CTERM motif